MNRIGKKELALEVFGVVFAVLLALWVDEWRDNAKLNQVAANQRARIIGEVRANLAEIISTDNKNKEYRDANDAIIKLDNWHKDKEKIAKLRWSIMSADLKNSAWKIALLNNAATVMDVDFLSEATNIYNHQDIYDAYVNNILSTIDEEVLMIDSDVKSALKLHSTRAILLSDFSIQLKSDYEKFLQKYDTKKK